MEGATSERGGTPGVKWGKEQLLSDGREEREERKKRLEQEKPEEREDQVDREDLDEWQPERVDS